MITVMYWASIIAGVVVTVILVATLMDMASSLRQIAAVMSW